MFETQRFIEQCKIAVVEGQKAIRELMAEAVADPAHVLAELGEPEAGGINTLHRDETLTVINFVWSPCMNLLPHNHNMFAVIGMYGGREDNIFWRRVEGEDSHGLSTQIEAVGADSLGPGQVATLGRDIIHSVANPITKLSAAIHVYGGDFFDPPRPRSQWDHETLVEQPWDMDYTRTVFRDAQARFDAGIPTMASD